jgi:hypothetical protein
MLIVLLDEPGLFVFPTLDAAVIGIEAPDAESGMVRAAFDERAVPYKVEWLRPNIIERRSSVSSAKLNSANTGLCPLVRLTVLRWFDFWKSIPS